MNENSKLFRIDKVALLSILFSAISLAASIALPWYFERRALQNTALRILQVRQDVYALGESEIASAENDPSFLASQPVPKAFGITINGTQYDYAIIAYWRIENAGRKPILASDFVKPVTISLSPEAKLLYIETVEASPNNSFGAWKEDETKTSASCIPELLNPGDYLVVCVAYQYSPSVAESRKLNWTARVSGLNQLHVETFESMRLKRPGIFDVQIWYFGVQIYILVLICAFLFALSLLLLVYTKRFPGLTARSIILLVVLSLFSLSTSEIICSWIFLKVSLAWHVSVPLLLAHSGVLLILIFTSPRHARSNA